jgi:hypothetical protein
MEVRREEDRHRAAGLRLRQDHRMRVIDRHAADDAILSAGSGTIAT